MPGPTAAASPGSPADRSPAGPDPLDVLARRALGLVPADGRVLLGITGSPGAGKTTLAIRLARRISALAAQATVGPASMTDAAVPDAAVPDAAPPLATHLPMDGFHLARATLDRLGRGGRKGAVDTFDGWGFVALLQRLLDRHERHGRTPEAARNWAENVDCANAVLIERSAARATLRVSGIDAAILAS